MAVVYGRAASSSRKARSPAQHYRVKLTMKNRFQIVVFVSASLVGLLIHELVVLLVDVVVVVR
jgi:hypothetical protein